MTTSFEDIISIPLLAEHIVRYDHALGYNTSLACKTARCSLENHMKTLESDYVKSKVTKLETIYQSVLDHCDRLRIEESQSSPHILRWYIKTQLLYEKCRTLIYEYIHESHEHIRNYAIDILDEPGMKTAYKMVYPFID